MKKIALKIQNHGFVADAISVDQYVLGASRFSARPILMPGGHGWGKFKPAVEIQRKNGVETMNCSNYGTHNALETLAAFSGFEDFPKNCSERYSGVGTGTTRSGNTPHTVAEIIRNEIGVIPEAELPFDESINSWDEYYSPKPMAPELLARGKKTLARFEIGHDWVFVDGALADKQEKLGVALERGTVALSVYAWMSAEGEDGNTYYIKRPGTPDNHWVQLLDFKEGAWWLVYDHYDKAEKYLAWEYDFCFAKVYYLDRIEQPETPQAPVYTISMSALWQSLVSFIKRALGLV